MILHDHRRRLPVVISGEKKATIGFLKRVTVLKGFSKLGSNFMDESKDFDFVFLTTRHNKFENHQRLYRK
jgi:hypothetical protein